MTQTYARDGSDAFNARLHETLLRIAIEVEKALGDNLVALILGGGYGRGEGGVVVQGSVEMPYNDLDLVLVVARKFRIPWDRLDTIRSSFGREIGIHVDFSRPLTLRDVGHWPCWLMWYDLLNGHVVLKGPQDVLTAHAPSALNKPLPVIEGTRLLLNRGTGLLWALRVARGVEAGHDEDFVRRNYQKCALALGDALLIAYGRFTTPYKGRDSLLATLEADEPAVRDFSLQSLYGEALRFKFRPDRVPTDPLREDDLAILAARWGEVFLHVERVRTGLDWSSLDEYVHWNDIREKDQHTVLGMVRNTVRNLQLGRWDWRYPRENLYRQLPILLGGASGSVRDWAQETEDFLRVWNRFN